ncbi:DNA cytosine methyltransferase [Brevibacillus aydinogluensis]|uniref:DNA (cytosine-5-)-methyltransferase n=1 Tax=Brevibacillus aydinogluensis TaxID=927786 RepID=A0AA48M5E9_9BACL|nr:DNA cytosine methyltransferase [Brevibacillus aydinogluensis]CAJ1000999.1 DNA (cytosine-5-)-methyltransferase [Brevibacillus aydinogluensis]
MRTTFTSLHLFCGIGGGALGFQQAREEWRGVVGRIETLAGIDCDPEACADFERITGAPAVQMDLFSRQQYIDFHGQEPPAEWREATPDDIWKATGGQAPDIVFTSPPCKGFSGLLPEKSAKTKKYQALNQLTVRGMQLCLEAFQDDLPALFLLENVPRIKTRGDRLLKEIKRLLTKYGYVFQDESHDCGEIGGLAQHRKRYLLIARNPQKLPNFVYKPPVRRVRAIGEVLGPLPLPDDPAGGKMHRLPRLQWKTWVRLALIPAGGDWQDLEKIEWENYRIQYEPRKGAMAVGEWDQPSGAVTGAAGFGRSNGTQAVADPRLTLENMFPSGYGVQEWDKPAQTIRAAGRIMNAPVSIADPRTGFKEGTHGAIYRVLRFDEPANTVTGAARPNNGAPCIADPRLGVAKGYTNKRQVLDWEGPASTVTGTPDIQSGAQSIADPRLGCAPRSGTLGVQRWDEPAKTVIGSGDIHAGAAAVADPRIPDDSERGVWVIIAEDGTWHRPLTTYELAMLQGFPTHLTDGTPFELVGNNDAKWRERIGNAVPPATAQAIAETMLRSLLAAQDGTWLMAAEEIWVAPHGGNEDVMNVVH